MRQTRQVFSNYFSKTPPHYLYVQDRYEREIQSYSTADSPQYISYFHLMMGSNSALTP
jgi:hypothetical protein